MTSCSTDSGLKPGKWHTANVTKVMAFRLNWDKKISFPGIIDQDDELNSSRIPQDGVQLTNAQITALEAAVTGGDPPGPASTGDMDALKELVSDLGIPLTNPDWK